MNKHVSENCTKVKKILSNKLDFIFFKGMIRKNKRLSIKTEALDRAQWPVVSLLVSSPRLTWEEGWRGVPGSVHPRCPRGTQCGCLVSQWILDVVFTD